MKKAKNKKRSYYLNQSFFEHKENLAYNGEVLFYDKLEDHVSNFSKVTGIAVKEIIVYFFNKGIIINDSYLLNQEQFLDLCEHFNLELQKKQEMDALSLFRNFKLDILEDKKTPRPPIVTIMGHVDHGKTTLLDTIRKSHIVKQEQGGITQHIGSYQIVHNNEKITFIDTPGHEAFSQMRSRGANVTDIIILVVSATEGVKPQTVESIEHARTAKNAEIIVAINKIDLPNSDPQKVKNELLKYDIVGESDGGNVIFHEVSALNGKGVNDLLNTIIVLKNIHELSAAKDYLPYGVVLETFFDRQTGYSANVIVLNGTLLINDFLIVGNDWCKVRFIENEFKKRVQEIDVSGTGKIFGLTSQPKVGSVFIGIQDEKLVKQISALRKESDLHKKEKTEFELLSKNIFLQNLNNANSDEKVLNLIVIADTEGSLEALVHSIEKLELENYKIKIYRKSIGLIKKADILLASSTKSIIYGFNTKVEAQAKNILKEVNVSIRYFKIIYSLLDDIKNIIQTETNEQLQYKYMGQATVKKIFDLGTKIGKIAGCYVDDGIIKNHDIIKIFRNEELIHEGQIDQLKRFSEFVKEVQKGRECGINIVGFEDLKENDVLKAYAPRKK